MVTSGLDINSKITIFENDDLIEDYTIVEHSIEMSAKDILKYLVKNDVDLAYDNYRVIQCFANYPEMIECIIDLDFPLVVLNKLLSYVCGNDNNSREIPMIIKLLSKGADPKVAFNDSLNDKFLGHSCIEVLQLLINHGLEITDSIWISVHNRRNLSVLEYLIDNNYSIPDIVLENILKYFWIDAINLLIKNHIDLSHIVPPKIQHLDIDNLYHCGIDKDTLFHFAMVILKYSY